MKTGLILIGFLLPMQTQNTSGNLMGMWKLEKIESREMTLVPKIDFYLKISDEGFEFNKDVNHCVARPRITKESIEYETAGCTKVCCDGGIDTIGGIIKYNGYYQVSDSLLYIHNELGKIFMRRV